MTGFLVRSLIFETRREKPSLRGLPTYSDTNQALQPQKMDRDMQFGFRKKRDCTIYEAKTKALISCAVTGQLIFAFVFAYAKAGFLMTQLIYVIVC